MHRIAVVVGSLRRDSINRQLAQALEKLGQGTFAFTYADIGTLPLYNDDLWSAPPQSVLDFKATVAAADAVLFVTPEYNRSIPGVLKNAIDWGSRLPRESAWVHKPVATVGASSGKIGTAVAQSHLRSILPVLGMSVMGTPDVYLEWQPALVDAEHTVTNESTRAFLQKFLASFDRWVALHKASPATPA